MSFITPIVEFFNHPFFIILGGATALLTILTFLYGVACWFFEISPIVFRLGLALWKRNVAIFSSADQFQSLKNTLIDSRIFTERKIVHITADNIERAKNETIYLVDWESFGANIEQVFSTRYNHQTAIIIFAKPGSIPQETMGQIANRPNTVVVNFRGRLLNDIITSLITTSYE